MFRDQSQEDYARAVRKAFWRKLHTWFTGKSNELLPYDEIRSQLPIKGQRYIGLRTVPLSKIIGSMGRYHDFDRAFAPTQKQTKSRWLNIDMARYQDIPLPPVDLYKIGEVYFVKDGNHRVSVAKERGQLDIDAYVTEVDVPISITEDLDIKDLDRKKAYAEFVDQIGLDKFCPEANLELTMPAEYPRLINHINDHRWYMGEKQNQSVAWEDALDSWYHNVYEPMLEEIHNHGISKRLSQLTEADLYLLVSEFQWFRREAYRDDDDIDKAVTRFLTTFNHAQAKQVLNTIRQAAWIDDQILNQDRTHFLNETNLLTLCPEAAIELSLPAKYAKLFEHIKVHQWYLGEQENRDIPYEEAVESWYNKVYTPLVRIIREQDILSAFPYRTEADLYVWLMDHHHHLEHELGWNITPENAALDLAKAKGKSSLTEKVSSVTDKIIDAVTPDSLESGPPAGSWRQRRRYSRLTTTVTIDILVPFSNNPDDWRALEQAILIAKKNPARVQGLHVLPQSHSTPDEDIQSMRMRFKQRCEEEGISGSLAIDFGNVSRTIAHRAQWVDLIVTPLNHPPSTDITRTISNGFRTMLRRSGRPVITVPYAVSPLNRILLAYDGSPKGDEAMFLTAYIAKHWKTELHVASVQENGAKNNDLKNAEAFLESQQVNAQYHTQTGAVGEKILELCDKLACDGIAMGGYGNNPMVEIVVGSTVNTLMRDANVPLLISN